MRSIANISVIVTRGTPPAGKDQLSQILTEYLDFLVSKGWAIQLASESTTIAEKVTNGTLQIIASNAMPVSPKELIPPDLQDELLSKLVDRGWSDPPSGIKRLVLTFDTGPDRAITPPV